MKKIIIFAIIALFISVNFACTQVGKNNQVANGDAATTEDNSEAAELDDDESTDEESPVEVVSPPKTPNSPEALVDELYKEEIKENTPFFQDKDRALVDKFFVKDLAEMVWKDAIDAKDDDVGKLDFDPLYNAQDAEVADLKVGDSEIKGDRATVTVTFLNFGEEQSLKYSLIKENGAWKIADIDYGDETLVKILKDETPTTKKATDK